MLLRRLARHVRAHDWFAVALDFLIVFVGVFVGLEAQKWDDGWKDSRARIAYLERIANDLELSINTNDAFRQEAVRIADLGRDAVRWLETCEIPQGRQDDFAAALFLASKADMPILRTSAIEEMRAVGKSDLLPSSLRSALADLERDQARTDALADQVTQRIVLKIDLVTERVRFDIDAETHPAEPVGAHALAYDLDALCGDGAFVNAVAALAEQNYRIAVANERRVAGQGAVRAKILEEVHGLYGQTSSSSS